MKEKHTPGPWLIEPHSTLDKQFMVGPGIWVDYDDVDHAEQEANGKLIAAAPELLEALNGLMTQVTRDCSIGSDPKYIELFESMQVAYRAVKKATE